MKYKSYLEELEPLGVAVQHQMGIVPEEISNIIVNIELRSNMSIVKILSLEKKAFCLYLIQFVKLHIFVYNHNQFFPFVIIVFFFESYVVE